MQGFQGRLQGEVGRIMPGMGASAGSSFGSSFASSVMSGVRSLGSQVWGTFTTGLGLATAGTIGLGASLANVGIGYNQLEQRARAAFTTILGSTDAANQMMDDLMEFAKQSPFPRQAFIEATQKMLGFGFAAKDVIPTLGVIEDSVAAIGGGAAELDTIVDVFSKIRSNGRVTFQEINRLGDVGINALKMLAEEAGVSSDEMRKRIEEGAVDADSAIRVLTESMDARFGGAAENIKNTWFGATDRVKAAWRDLGSALIEPFIDPEGGGFAVEWANDLADGLRNLQTQVQPLVERYAPMLAEFLDRIVGRVSEWMQSIDTAKLEGWVDKLKDAGPAMSGLAAGLGLLGLKSIPVIGGLMPALGPALGAIGAFLATNPDAKEVFSGIADAFGDLGDAVKNGWSDAGVMGALSAFTDWFEENDDAALSWLRDTREGILDWLETDGLELKEQIAQWLEEDAVPVIGEALGEALVLALEGAVRAAGTILGEKVRDPQWWFSSFGGLDWQSGLASFLSTEFGAGVAVAGYELRDAIGRAFITARTVIFDHGGALMLALLRGMGRRALAVVQFIAQFPLIFIQAFASAGSWLFDAGRAVLAGFIRGITSMIPELGNVLADITGFIVRNKGPIEVDRRLLFPAGKAIMGGLNDGLLAGAQQVVGTARAITAELVMALSGGWGAEKAFQQGHYGAAALAPVSVSSPAADRPVVLHATIEMDGRPVAKAIVPHVERMRRVG